MNWNYKKQPAYHSINIHLIISTKPKKNYSFKVFGFKIINCTFATPLLGMECLIKKFLL